MTSSYDVFISYNTLDHVAVTTLAEQLKRQQMQVFLDRWHLVPGQPWPERLKQVLHDCSAVAICIGPGEMGPWQLREMYFALERQNQEPGFPVIPVLLPGANPSLGFLSQNMWVDFRGGIDEPMALNILTAAVRGESLDASIKERLQETINSICPYRGLHYFREEDASFFFGRDKAIEALQDKLRDHQFVALVGASGSGKSSVVRAGLLPKLRKQTHEPWEIITIVPGTRPLYNLAAGLMPLLQPEQSENELLLEIGKQAKAFLEGTLQIMDVVQRILTKQPGTAHLLLVVDQWEELYTLAMTKTKTEQDGNPQQRQKKPIANTQAKCFIDGLLDACDAGKMTIVMTLRGDFMGQAIAYRRLSDCMQNAQINLGPMQQEELRLAIEQPAQKVDIRFEPGLIGVLLDDVGDEPGNLPLLEFVLERLWLDEQRRGGQFRHQAYRDMGELKGALADKADALFFKQTPQDQKKLRHILLQLVHPSEQADYTRRRASFDELGDNAQPLVNQLIKQRLVISNQDKDSGNNTLEVTHEALIRDWPLMQQWLQEDRDFLLWQERLRSDYEHWQQSKEYLIGQRLEDALRWLKLREIGLKKQNFIKRSFRHSCLQQWKNENRDFLIWRERIRSDYEIWLRSKEYLTGQNLKDARRWLKLRKTEINQQKQDFIKHSIRHSRCLLAGWSSAILLPLLLLVSFYMWAKIENISHKVAGYVVLAKTGIYILQPDMKTIPPDKDCQQSACKFVMGSSDADDGDAAADSDEKPPHEVQFHKPFKIGRYEVTFDEYQVFTTLIASDGGCENNVNEKQHTPIVIKDEGRGKVKQPIFNVNWHDAQCYAKWLSKKTGKSYRLPTEAEWEYAARAGTTSKHYWDEQQAINDFARFSANSDSKTHPVGKKQANQFGLYDMSGNGWEWVQDCWHENYDEAPADGTAWEEANQGDCGRRVLRGGSWYVKPEDLRTGTANRVPDRPDERYTDLGFRLAQDLN